MKKETALLAAMLLFGVVVLPVVIWFIGKLVFGAYGGAGYVDFYNSLGGKLREGNPAAWFLVMSPYLAVQIVRLGLFGWRHAGKM